MKISPFEAEIHADGQTWRRSSTIFRKAVIIDEFHHHMSPLGMGDIYVHACSPMFTQVHQCSPMFTKVHTCSPTFTQVHLRSHIFTHVHSSSPMFTQVHACSPTFTQVYPCSPTLITHNCSCMIDILWAILTNFLTSMSCNDIHKNAARFLFPYFNAQSLSSQTDRSTIYTTIPI